MTVTWVLVSAVAVSALLLLALWRRRARSSDQPSRQAIPWVDALAATSPIIAALMIGISGLLVTDRVLTNLDDRATRDRQELAAQTRTRERSDQMQRRQEAIEKFLPQFSKSEPDKTAAILAIRATGDFDLATTMASLFPSSGSVSALEIIARQAPDDRRPAVMALAAMDTEESRAALSRVFQKVTRALIACEGKVIDGGPAKRVAGVVWNDQWLVTPLGELKNAKPVEQPAEQRDQQPQGERLTRFRLTAQAAFTPIEFSNALPEPGETVFGVGLSADGRPAYPRIGVVARSESGVLLVRFAAPLDQVAGSLVVLPSGTAVGLLSHDQHSPGSYRYIKTEDVSSWLELVDREQRERDRRK